MTLRVINRRTERPKLRVPKVAYCCFSMDITFLWSKTAESAEKSDIWAEFAQLSYFRDSQPRERQEEIISISCSLELLLLVLSREHGVLRRL
jgi:hypothetical protein